MLVVSIVTFANHNGARVGDVRHDRIDIARLSTRVEYFEINVLCKYRWFSPMSLLFNIFMCI